VETVEETVRRRRSTTIIYQFRILMSERLIQKASTLRKPKRSTLLSLPGGWLPSPVFLPLASDTLCYSRMISDWPPPRLLFCPFAYCLFICTSLLRVSSLLSHHSFPLFVILFFLQNKYFYYYFLLLLFLQLSFSLKFSALVCACLYSFLHLDLLFSVSFSYFFKFIIFYFHPLH